MKLFRYIKIAKLDLTQTAARLGVSYDALWRWLQTDPAKRRFPNHASAQKIVKLTKGAVTIEDLHK